MDRVVVDYNPGSYLGTIKSFNPGQYGFIECAETKEKYGSDIFLNQEEMLASQASVGEPVIFEVYMNNKQRPQAKSVFRIAGMQDHSGKVWLSSSFNENAPVVPPQRVPPMGHFAPPMPMVDRSAPSGAKPRKEIVYEVVSVGTLKRVNEEKGFAFLECPPQRMMHGRDVFVPTEVLAAANATAQLVEGDRVAFKVVVHRGMPQVAKDGGLVKLPTGVEEAGAVKFFMSRYELPFGFVTCENAQVQFGTTDVYIAHDQVTASGVTIDRGSVIAFNITPRPDGSLRASDIVLLDLPVNPLVPPQGFGTVPPPPRHGYQQFGAVPPRPFTAPPPRHSVANVHNDILVAQDMKGTVKSFNTRTHYGFVECAEVKASFGFDAFLPQREIEHAGLPLECIGASVIFDVTTQRDGKPVVQNMRQDPAAPSLTGIRQQRAAPY
jgi:cold shock CspA family protein